MSHLLSLYCMIIKLCSFSLFICLREWIKEFKESPSERQQWKTISVLRRLVFVFTVFLMSLNLEFQMFQSIFQAPITSRGSLYFPVIFLSWCNFHLLRFFLPFLWSRAVTCLMKTLTSLLQSDCESFFHLSLSVSAEVQTASFVLSLFVCVVNGCWNSAQWHMVQIRFSPCRDVI